MESLYMLLDFAGMKRRVQLQHHAAYVWACQKYVVYLEALRRIEA